MRRHRLYQPYVRRANGREKADSLKMTFRLAFYQSLGKPFYVLVQRGFPNLAIAVHRSRFEIARGVLVVHAKRMTFRTWTFRLQRQAAARRTE